MRKYKLVLGGVLLAALSFISYTGLANAHSFRSGENVVVDKSQKVQESLFAAGNNVDISSEVFGDVFCAGQNVTVSGRVHGDVICAGQTVNVTGEVDGDVRLAGQNVTVGGNVKGNATVAGQAFTLSSNAKIAGDVTLGATDGNFNGTVGRDLAASGSTVVIASEVGRNIKGDFENLELSQGAKVKGSIEFTSNNDIKRASEAVVDGPITRSDAQKSNESKDSNVLGFSIGWFIYCLLAMLTIAMALALLFPRLLHSITNQAVPRPWKALLTGFVASFAVPVILVLLAITIIGLPLAFVLGLLWLVAAILSGPVFGYLLGRTILRDSRQPLLIMLAGASLLLILYFIPILGIFAMLFAFWIGTGMLLLELFRRTPRPAYTLADTPQKPASKKK